MHPISEAKEDIYEKETTALCLMFIEPWNMVISGGMLLRNRIQQWRYFARVRYRRRQTDCLANIRVTVGWLGKIYFLLLYFFL
jgi:hypothetical protein